MIGGRWAASSARSTSIDPVNVAGRPHRDWRSRRPGQCPQCRRRAIDQRLELLDAGVRVAPIAEQHRGCRPSAECLGLRKVRDVERHLRSERISPVGSVDRGSNDGEEKVAASATLAGSFT
jgi:hypothetical protein